MKVKYRYKKSLSESNTSPSRGRSPSRFFPEAGSINSTGSSEKKREHRRKSRTSIAIAWLSSPTSAQRSSCSRAIEKRNCQANRGLGKRRGKGGISAGRHYGERRVFACEFADDFASTVTVRSSNVPSSRRNGIDRWIRVERGTVRPFWIPNAAPFAARAAKNVRKNRGDSSGEIQLRAIPTEYFRVIGIRIR